MTIITPADALPWLERYRLYLDVVCPVEHCQARRGEPCRNTPQGKVHESRQLEAFALKFGFRAVKA